MKKIIITVAYTVMALFIFTACSEDAYHVRYDDDIGKYIITLSEDEYYDLLIMCDNEEYYYEIEDALATVWCYLNDEEDITKEDAKVDFDKIEAYFSDNHRLEELRSILEDEE